MSVLHKEEGFEIFDTYEAFVATYPHARMEVHEGVGYFLAAPGVAHQEVSGNLTVLLKHHFRGQSCKVFAAPFDVELSHGHRGTKLKVYQPDLVVICDLEKLADGKRLKGTPDLIIEILSPATASDDKITKFNTYQAAGVKEYWIVDPVHQTVDIYVLREGRYMPTKRQKGFVRSELFQTLQLAYGDIFEGLRPILGQNDDDKTDEA